MVLWISTERYLPATTVLNYEYVSIPPPEPDQLSGPVSAIHTKAAYAALGLLVFNLEKPPFHSCHCHPITSHNLRPVRCFTSDFIALSLGRLHSTHSYIALSREKV